MTVASNAGQESASTIPPGAETATQTTTAATEAATTTATTTQTPATTTAAPTLADLQKQFDDAQTLIKSLRTEAAGNRVKANEAQTKLEALERESLSEADKVKADLAKLQTETLPSLEKRNRQLEVQVAATLKNVVDPEAAALLLDWESVAKGASIADALDALITAKPYLVKAQTQAAQAVASTTSPGASTVGSGPASYTRAQLDAMSTDDYIANRDSILKAMAEGRVK